ncbi:MAG: PspC domain-containing protein [Acidobacteria bacterium]|nr:PspC domain-containing protein [Acidobacteriota bacterium]
MEKKAYRSKRDCRVAGVCGGLGEYFHVDSTLLRIGMILLAFYAGVGVILYLVAWLLLPPNPEQEATEPFQRTERAREKVIATVRDVGERIEETWKAREGSETGGASDKGLILGAVVLLVGLVFFLNGIGAFSLQFTWLRWGVIWPAALVGLGIFLIYDHLRGAREEPPAEP